MVLKLAKPMYDLSSIKAIPIKDAAIQLGLSLRGNVCRCASPDHEDRHPSMVFNLAKNSFKCFGCNASGSVIDLVMLAKNSSFQEAIAYLAETFTISSKSDCKTISNKNGHHQIEPCKSQKSSSLQIPFPEYTAPSEEWGKICFDVLKYSRTSLLYSQKTESIRDYLQNERGLNKLNMSRLGWVVDEYRCDDLGYLLRKDIWVPSGLVIPVLQDGCLHRLRIRREDGCPKYQLLTGSSTIPMKLGQIFSHDPEYDGDPTYYEQLTDSEN